uniref:C2H2-type domain-containing protein n=1 Tax=Periophthalmus magnuspinnatus TaxID=409849 RepID=A0A3B4ABX3_9GOBI
MCGFYYPYNRDNQGAHSSAGIPSLLNSPFSQSSINGHCAPGMTPSSGISTAPLFRFQPRRESVDWRRMNAVDIDAVVSQMDVGVLQEYITTVTYCSLDGERCPRCQSPVDPALVKLLRLAQLTVEYLLHCQELLTAEMHMMEERLEAAGKDRVQLQAQLKEKDEQIKTLNEELKQRRKVIRTQQRILAPSIINSHKCLHCEKSFLNATFLQNHMQRRHPEEYDAKQESLHRDLIRELDRFKAEEMARMDQKIEGCRDGIRREIEFLYTRNIQALNLLIFLMKDVNQQQSTRPGKSSPVQMEPEKDLDNYNEMQKHAIHKLEQQLKKQVTSRLQNMKDQHESEKNQLLNELNRMQITVSEQQEHSQRLRQDLGRKLQEKEHIIKSQKEQVRVFYCSRTTPVLTKQASVTSVSSLPSRGKTTEVTKTTLTKMKMDSDDEETWSDVSELQEIDPKQSFKDQNGNVERKKNKISEMGKKIEKQFTDRLGKKPAGGVSILPERKDEVQELSCTDLEESNEWSSSVEDKVSKPVHGSAALRKSLDSASTSVWGTSTGKGPKSSLTEASTGSTLKSTIYSISDASDDDFSNN